MNRRDFITLLGGAAAPARGTQHAAVSLAGHAPITW
jgi:hypothetical protein